MGKTQLVLVFGFFVSVLIFLAPSMFQHEAQDRLKPKPNDATPIQPGKMSDRQREHAKLFAGYGTGKKLIDLVRKYGSANVVHGPGLEAGNPFAPSLTRPDRVKIATCSSDAIVIGTVLNKNSQLTIDGEFIFTDYEVRIENIANNRNSNFLKKDNTIIVSRSGGAVSVDGHLVTAQDSGSPALTVDQTYLFFLSFIQDTGDYTTRGVSPVSKSDQKLGRLLEQEDNLFMDSDVNLVLEEVRIAASECSTVGIKQ